MSGAGGGGAGTVLIIFLVCAAVLALLGLQSEVREVEAVAIAAAAPARTGCGRAAVAGLAGGRSLAAEGQGAATSAAGRGVRLWDSSSAYILAPILPNLVAPLSEGRPVLVIPQVENFLDLGRHLAEKQDLLDLIHQGWLQGIELVHQDRCFVRPKVGIFQPFDGPLVVTETVLAQL